MKTDKNKIKKDKIKIGVIVFETCSVILLAAVLSIVLNPVMGMCGAIIIALIIYFFMKCVFKQEAGLEKPSIMVCVNAIFATTIAGNAFYVIIGIMSIEKNTVFQTASGIALALVLFLPFLYLAGKVTQKKKKDGFYPEICISASLIILVFFVLVDIPSELFLNNNSEFTFSYGDLILALYPVISLALSLIPFLILLPDIIKRNLAAFFSSIVICVYVQNMFFNKYIGEITGAHYNWMEKPAYAVICTLVWCGILFAAFWFANRQKTVRYHFFASAAVFILVSSSFLFVLIKAPEKNFDRKQYYLDPSEQFTVGSEKNVVILIADAVDNTYVEQMYKRNPELFDAFHDFTMYTDTCSVYDVTNQSIEQMLYSYTQKEGTQNTDVFFGKFRDAGYRILMFHAAALGLDMSEKPFEYIDNYVYTGDTKDVARINSSVIRKGMVKISLFKALPCMAKATMGVENTSFSTAVVYSSSKYEVVNGNSEFEEMLQLRKNEAADCCFIYQHLEGAHFPCDDYIGESEHCLRIFADYLEQMNALDTYENSVIVIAADHGMHDDAEGVEFGVAATPMFLIKKPGEKHEQIQISKKPLYYRDFQATILKYADLYDTDDEEIFGKTIDDYEENDVRTRVWFDRGFIHNGVWRKYTYSGDFAEFQRVVKGNEFEEVSDGTFDFSEIPE